MEEIRGANPVKRALEADIAGGESEPESSAPATKKARVAEKVTKPKQEDRLTVKERKQLADAFPNEEADFLNFMVTSHYDGNVDQMLHDRLRLQPRDFNIQDHQCYVANRLRALRKHFSAVMSPLVDPLPVLTSIESPLQGLDHQCPSYWSPQTSSCVLVPLSPTTIEYQRVFTNMLINDPHLTDVAVVHSITRIQNKPAFGMFQLTMSQMDDTSGQSSLYLGCSDTDLARLKAHNYAIEMLNPGNRYSPTPALYQRLSTSLTVYDMTSATALPTYDILLCRVVLGRSEALDNIRTELPGFHPGNPWPLVHETLPIATDMAPNASLASSSLPPQLSAVRPVQPIKHPMPTRPALPAKSSATDMRFGLTVNVPGLPTMSPLTLPITHNPPPTAMPYPPPIPNSTLPVTPPSPKVHRYVAAGEHPTSLAIHSIYTGSAGDLTYNVLRTGQVYPEYVIRVEVVIATRTQTISPAMKHAIAHIKKYVNIIQRSMAQPGYPETDNPMRKTLEFVRTCFDISIDEPDRFKEQFFKYDQVLVLNSHDEAVLVNVTLTTKFFDLVLGTLNRLVTLYTIFKL